jgi:hypothetical protein
MAVEIFRGPDHMANRSTGWDIGELVTKRTAQENGGVGAVPGMIAGKGG